MEPFENASFWNHSVSGVDRWNRRLLKTVPKKASYTVVPISVCGRFSVDDREQSHKSVHFPAKTYLRGQVKTIRKRKWERKYFYLHTRYDSGAWFFVSLFSFFLEFSQFFYLPFCLGARYPIKRRVPTYKIFHWINSQDLLPKKKNDRSRPERIFLTRHVSA